MRSALYRGTLVHARREPVRNVFRYPVAYFLLDLDELDELRRFWPVRLGLVRFRDRDHFDGRPVKEAVLELADDPEVERVLCLTQLRVFGYVFNPVSFYWCYRRASPAGGGSRQAEPGSATASSTSGHDARRGRASSTVPSGLPSGGARRETAEPEWELSCVVAELNNTFGERLPEVLRGPALRYEQAKRLHVSPFFGLDQDYDWAFSHPEEEVWARVHVREDGRRPLTAVLHGRRAELSSRALAGFLVRYPLLPLRVVALIHWQALRLFWKRVPFHHKPPFVPGEGSVRA